MKPIRVASQNNCMSLLALVTALLIGLVCPVLVRDLAPTLGLREPGDPSPRRCSSRQLCSNSGSERYGTKCGVSGISKVLNSLGNNVHRSNYTSHPAMTFWIITSQLKLTLRAVGLPPYRWGVGKLFYFTSLDLPHTSINRIFSNTIIYAGSRNQQFKKLEIVIK